jgi:hypothetical protein
LEDFPSFYSFFSPSGYSPSPGDLAYPEKLEMMENIADHLARQQLDHQQGRMTISAIWST